VVLRMLVGTVLLSGEAFEDWHRSKISAAKES
jgi:hypothetical protein